MFPIRSQAAAPSVALAFFGFAFGTPLAAATPVATMVADIGSRVTIDTQNIYLAPRDGSVVRNGRLYFYFDDGIHGLELWASDGTAAGTGMVRDVCPGACGAVWFFSYLALAATPDAVFFAANDGVHGLELWLTDGSEAGTRLVRDILPGFGASVPRTFSALGDRLVFWADDGVHGEELWSSDGTTAGTQLVVDSSPGAVNSYRGAACVLGDRLVFAYSSGLWRTDGTAAGTSEFAPVNADYQNYLANSNFICLPDRVIFSGNGDHGVAPEGLWVSDGTAAGTQQLAAADFWFGEAEGAHAFLLSYDYDTSAYTLWETDGSAVGTSATPVPPGLRPSSMSGAFAAVGGALYFIGRDDAHGAEVRKFNSGTFELLVDLNPGPADGFPLEWGYFETGRNGFLTRLGDRLVFLASDGVHGLEPWSSQGVPGDAVRLADLAPGAASAHPDFLRSFHPQLTLGDALMFRWQDENLAVHLWKTDGTVAGSAPVADLRTLTSAWSVPAPAAAIYSSLGLACFAPTTTGVTFFADDGPSGTEPWFSDGTSAGTHRIADFSPGIQGSSCTACAPIGGHCAVLLDGGDPYRSSLFATSGAEGSLQELAQLPDLSGGVGDPEMFQERVVFSACGLPATDGTPEGTELLEPDFTIPIWAVESEADLLFSSLGNLFVSDGTPGSSVELLPPPPPDESLFAVRLAALNDSLLFFLWNGATGQELWRSDGSAEGTFLVKDILPGPASGVHDGYFGLDPMFLTELVPLGPIALFAADDGVQGEELWRTDGTAAGTVMVRDIVSGSYPSSPRDLTRVGDFVFFSAEAVDSGRELWISDGTAGGTRRVADIVPGTGSSVPQELAAIRDELWFSAWTPDFGREPWRARGAGNGLEVERLADLAPGPLSSSPLIFKNAGADVFTVANDNSHGFELWKLRDPDLLFADDFESSGLALWAD